MKDFSAEIDRSLDILFQVEKLQEKKKVLLDKPKLVYLQVMLFKLPFTAPRNRKLVSLRHSLYGDEPEICLFVPNRKTEEEYKKTTDELIDFCIDYYTEFLEKHKVKGITTIMPFKQLTSEYGTYDLRRKLVRRFDLFLCKKSLLYNEKFISSLGKIFKVANKIPFGVRFPRYDADFDPEFKKNIERAIHTAGFYISRFSDNYSIPFGTVANTKKELKENLEMVLQQLFERKIIPGGLQNIRAMYLWPSQSKSIPMYFNLEIPVGMKTPRDKVKKKKIKAVEGELSTQPNKKVYVTPTGSVFVSKLETKSKNNKVTDEPPEIDFEDDESFKDGSDVDDEEDGKDILKTKMKAEKEEDSETEDDEEIEKREKRLLSAKSFMDDSDVDDEEDKKGTLKTKIKVQKEEDDTETEDDEEIEKRERRFLQEKRQAEEEETEEEETNENLNTKKKSKRKRKNESGDEGKIAAKKKKSGKGDEEIEKRERRFLQEKRQAEEEETEEEETNENLSTKKKSKRKRKNESGDEGTIAAKKKKSGKGEQKAKMKKSQRKTLMKQEKCKLKEKINQKRKIKEKKV